MAGMVIAGNSIDGREGLGGHSDALGQYLYFLRGKPARTVDKAEPHALAG
jgi:hypothetical protein